MELKEDMYVRTKEGNIAKIIDNRDNVIVKTDDNTTHLRSMIIKASDNLTDLIEVGDIIETPKGVFQVGYIENNIIYTDDSKVIVCLRKDEHLCFENTTIKSIVTKEMFNSVKYEVE